MRVTKYVYVGQKAAEEMHRDSKKWDDIVWVVALMAILLFLLVVGLTH